LSAGNSDVGSPKNVAQTSVRNAPASTGVRRMNEKPAATEESRDRSGRSAGELSLASVFGTEPSAGAAERQPPGVDGVDQRPAEQADREQRQQRRQRDQPDRDRRPGEVPHLQGERDVVIAPPTADRVDPAHRRRKAGDSRSGVRSARRRTGDDGTAGAALPPVIKCGHIERSAASRLRT